jgi:carbon storage regulator
MLVLSRKRDERLVLIAGGERIELVFKDLSGSRLQVGIDAPRSVKIIRKELEDQDESVNDKSAVCINDCGRDEVDREPGMGDQLSGADSDPCGHGATVPN